MSVTRALLRDAALAGGQALRTGIRGVATVRPARKPLHPRGALVRAVVRRRGGGWTGSPFLDEEGDLPAVVRLSRSVGLPTWAPDVQGLALRVEGDDGPGDLLFSSTGLGPLTRFLLTATRDPGGRPLTTLLPNRSPTGPVLLAAVRVDDTTYQLRWARPRGDWTTFGELLLEQADAPDAEVSFDPVLHEVPGLATYDWVRRLREPAYATARDSRS